MTNPAMRRTSDRQRAAHILIGPITDRVAQLRNDLVHAELASQEARRTADARRDWAEIRAKAAARLEGATDILDLIRDLARGT